MPVLEAFRDHFRPHNALLVHDGRYTQPNAHVYMPRFVSEGYISGQSVA